MTLRVHIASPCKEDWDAMQGDDRVRNCASCKLNVFNTRELTEAEILSLIKSANGGRLCMRVYQRADGTVLTKDCPRGVALLRRRLAAALTMSAALVLTAFGFRFEKQCATSGDDGTWFSRVVTTRFTAAREELRTTRTLGPIIERFWPAPPMVMKMGDYAPAARGP